MIVWGRSPGGASEATQSDSGSAGFGSDRASPFWRAGCPLRCLAVKLAKEFLPNEVTMGDL